jgi:limonene 1,2-monooxygenase
MLKFGAFVPPYHIPDQNPTLALKRDLELVEHLDRLGLDEVWFGEHHSLGYETISSPELMIAAAAMRTRRIMLGTGVISLPYHHPFIVADRLVMLDHLTEGRLKVGFGPGVLPSDHYMMKLDYSRARDKMAEALEAVLQLLTSDEPVSRDTEWFSLQDAQLNLRPFQRPLFDVYVASAVSPTGGRLAGRHGLGLLSFTASSPEAHEALRQTWAIAAQEAERYEQTVDRSKWGLVLFVHLADSEEQARQDVRYGLRPFMEYFARLNPFGADLDLSDTDEIVDHVNTSGMGCIGTPERAVTMIRGFSEATGGFGTFIPFAHEWANRPATLYSYELLARHVVPQFQGSTDRAVNAFEWGLERGKQWAQTTRDAWAAATTKYDSERRVPVT